MNIKELYKDLFDVNEKRKTFAENNNKEMNATNVELWHKSRFVIYGFALLGNLVSFLGCSYGLQLYLSDSIPGLFAWAIAILVSLSLELSFIVTYQIGLIKIFQGKSGFKYALPYIFIASSYIFVYFPTTYGFQSFVKNTDKSISKIENNFSKDSANIARSFDIRIDSLSKRIATLETERNNLSYYVDITRNNQQQKMISSFVEKLESQKTAQLERLYTRSTETLNQAKTGLINNSQRHYNLALIILIYVFVIYTAIMIIKHFADEEFEMLNKAVNNNKPVSTNKKVTSLSYSDVIEMQKDLQKKSNRKDNQIQN